MSAFLVSAASFLVAIAVLITVHEFGHFWVARRLGVKVLRFSIGFGRPLWKRVGRIDQTEYVIAAIPLGGYVKMLDEQEGDVAAEEVHRAFNRQRLWKRTAIVSAGPAFNFLFAILAYWLIFIGGVEGMRPVIGHVEDNSIAAIAGLQDGDEFVGVEGKLTQTWDIATLALLNSAMEGGSTSIEIRREGSLRVVRLDWGQGNALLEGSFVLDVIGVKPWRPRLLPVVDRTVTGGAAERAGLTGGDLIIAADSQPITSWAEWVEFVQQRPGRSISVVVERDGARVDIQLVPESTVDNENRNIGRIGAYVRVPPDLEQTMRTEVRFGPVDALFESLRKSWNMSVLMIKMLGKMIIGEASVENLSGPISIAQYAGQSASIGLVPFVTFLAVISISLGIINLLPVPLLDGGHLLYYMIEAVKGGPLSENAQALGQRLGVAFLIILMGLAFYNDLSRVFG